MVVGGNTDSQAWLTYTLTDSDVPAALTLYFSMKRVFTSRKLAVLVSRNVSLPLRQVLHHSFDFFFNLEEEHNTPALKDNEFVKLAALTLKGFSKLVCLEPSMLAIQNSDDIFDQKMKAPSKSLVTEWEDKQLENSMSIFVARPSIQGFNDLMEGLQSSIGTGLVEYLRDCELHQDELIITMIVENKYNQQLSSQKDAVLSNPCQLSIVNVTEIPLDSAGTEKWGFCEQLILEHRKNMYTNHVVPLLRTVGTGSVSRSLDKAFQNSTRQPEPIAIVGMSCRYPRANNLQEFWSLLLNGEDGTGHPPEFRWLREQSPRTVVDSRNTNAGFLKCPVDSFDAKFFGISPKEMIFLDPQHRLLHELVWEGLEDAAINPQSLRGTNGGVFIGSWTNNYKEILERGENTEFHRMLYIGNSIGASAARISFLLGMTGPSVATESGCSSAMVALHLGCSALQNRETNLALACGVNLLLHPFHKDEMPMLMAPDGRCKTFDAKADGFTRAEGCGVLVLKRLSDAVRDEDKIWALIRGSATMQEGISKTMGRPTVHCESLAMTKALQNAGVNPSQVSYVEAHGTGTVVGDPMEVAAIAKAYHSKQRKEPLLIGSVKTNVGHTESCSGITGVMKVVLALHHEIIPPHRNFETLNPAIDLDAVPARIPLKPVEWKREAADSRFAGVSSFGITGTDAHVIIEEAPKLPPKTLSQNAFQRPLHIMKISAKTQEALDILLNNYNNHFNSTGTDFKDLAYAANVGGPDFSHRVIVIAESNEDAIKSIEQAKLLRGEMSTENLGKVCFLFTGQGSQYPGMAKQLYETSPVFRMHFEYCEKTLKDKYNIDITQVWWSEDKPNEVSRTIYSQTSIFCVEYALLKLWESWGVKPDCVLGHSLGEFAAGVCAGLLNVEDAIKLVAERSLLIDNLPRGKMLVIKGDKTKVDTLMNMFAAGDPKKELDYAALNSAEQTVVAGDSELVIQFSEFCTDTNLKCIVLEATHAFHSKHMDPMLDGYRKIVRTVKKLGGNGCKYISGMRGMLLEADEIDAEYWVRHTREKVLFMDASKKAVEFGCNIFIEIGPQPVLCALTMMNNETQLICLPSLKKNENEWETLLNTLGKLYLKGLSVDWRGFDQFYNRSKVSLPQYPFIRKRFWPTISEATGVTIHPLLGSVFSNASSTRLFQSGLNLNLKTLEYMKDHAIGESIVFPCAGFLEMCLAAGLATVEGFTSSLPPPTRPMKLENLMIEAPLYLQESKIVQLQTVVELNISTEKEGYWNDMKVNIFKRTESESSKWLLHAKSTFSPLLTTEEKNERFDILSFKSIVAMPSNEEFIQETYDKLASLGLKFGPNFRSLEKVWISETEGTLLAQVKFSSEQSTSSQSSYIIHPVVIDAMIQAIMMLRLTSHLKKKLYVPIKIGTFLWFSAPSTDCTGLYIHAFSKDKTDTSSSGTALLVDSSGKKLALMSSVEFVDTTVKAIESVMAQQTSSMPDLWEEVWKPQVGPNQHRIDHLKLRANSVNLNVNSEHDNILPSDLAATFHDVEKLVYLQLLRCLYECGWKPFLSEKLSESSLLQQLDILSRHGKYVSFILQVLEMEGCLSKDGMKLDSVTWTVTKMPPSLEETEDMLNSHLFTSDLTSRYSLTPLLTNVGKKLSGILRGQEIEMNILFPAKNQCYPSLAEFYSTYNQVFQMSKPIAPKILERFRYAKKKMCGARSILRILEVGAGAGFFTDMIIGALVESGIEFEYTFTDISSVLLAGAEKRFEKYGKNLKFKMLNIEKDPLDQGFIPEYFDYVCAFDVIHITKNIRETLGNLRMLMKPHGLLDIQEMTSINRSLTFVFGLLEEFCRFEDLELRPTHCCLSAQSWRDILYSSGFEVDDIFSMVMDHHSYIWAVRTSAPLEIVKPQKPKYWLIFHQEDNKTPNQVSSDVIRRIESMTSRKVICVQRGSIFSEVEEATFRARHSFKIRMEEEIDFITLFQTLKKLEIELEGIVYCWALMDDATSASYYEVQENILRPYFFLSKSFLNAGLESFPRLIGITRGVFPVGNKKGVINFPFSTLCGFSKSLKNENQDKWLKFIDVDEGTLDENQLEELFSEFWHLDSELLMAYRDGKRFVPKLQPHKPTGGDLKLIPGSDRFQLVLPETRSISDLEFGLLDAFSLEENEVEVQIKASALNFKDVLSVIKPSDEFKDINGVGFDLAGVVRRVGANVSKWKVGDRVMGCNLDNTGLPSHAKLDQDQLMKIPEKWNFCEAATIPAVYVTSFVCLIETAKIKKEDIVLIHTATGGVGLSAIEICKHVGCTIIATAGSKRKQTYLKNLGIKHIFHSRNTKYGDQILELTNGSGVDVVLNSLTSEGFKEATLKACVKGARFIEMSKLNIWKKEDVKKVRPDVKYTIVDVSTSDVKQWNKYLERLCTLLEKNVVKPIPYARFDGLNVREALQHMQKAKHIGKIVCAMPELRNGDRKMEAYTPIFNERSSYLITGGMGGIGFIVCQWMVKNGAKHVILAGRSPPSSSMQNKINELNSKGANIKAVHLDVGNFDKCKNLFQTQIEQFRMPELKGVMHAAGTVSDGLINKQEWENLASVFTTKIKGTLNLHELTKDLNLEHFVLFSSSAALFGPPGQCNHAAGNSFEDAFAHYRQSIGLPATSINWGQWGEVGVATEVDLPGIKPFSNLQGLTGLQYALKSQQVQLGILKVSSFVVLSNLFPHIATYLDERIWKKTVASSGGSTTIKSDEFWQQYDSASDLETKTNFVKEQLRNILRNTLKLDDSDVIGDNVDLQEMGIDSLMYVEIKNGLQNLLGGRLNVSASTLKDCNTVLLISTTLVQLIEGQDEGLELGKPTMAEVNELIREDCHLPEQVSAQPGQRIVPIQEIQTVLLTGCTGTLGPYILKELTNLPQIKKVFCLIRPSKKAAVEERLRQSLGRIDLLSKVDLRKIHCVPGNVAETRLGLEPSLWEGLSGCVDAIFHCAGKIQHTEQYRKRKSTKDTRAVNVNGTRHILEFACEKKLKRIYHASSLLALTNVDEYGQISECWSEVGDYDNLTTYGYPITKFVGDMLMKQGVERGIPAKVFRLPLLVGESETGRCCIENNHAILRYMFIMKNGIMPSNPLPMILLPVDTCAWVSVRLFFEEDAPSGVYNISPALPGLDQEFVEVAERFGHPVEIVESSEFLKRVQISGEDNRDKTAFSIFKELYNDEETVMGVYVKSTPIKKWMEGGHDDKMWISNKVLKYIPSFYEKIEKSIEFIYRDLSFLKSKGWFKKFGL